MISLRPGLLLVATAALAETTFAATVVLLLDVDAPDAAEPGRSGGALGVVLNRPTDVPVHGVLAGWGQVVDDPAVLFQGGPVSTDGALAVGLLTAGDEVPAGFRPVGGGLGLVDLDAPVEAVRHRLSRLRIFAGYAGWGTAQLDAEIEEGSWHVVAGRPQDAFGVDTTDLRREVLRRQPGDLAWQATRPADATLN